MLKTLTTVFVLLMALARLGTSNKERAIRIVPAVLQATSNQRTSLPQQPLVQQLPVLQEDKGKHEHDSKEKLGYWKEAFGPAYAANWVLVGVGIITGLLAWLTLRGIKKQADLMGKQATAMDRTLVLQFRPQIIVRGFLVDDEKAVILWLTNAGGSKAEVLMFKLYFTVGVFTVFNPEHQALGEQSFIYQPGEMKVHKFVLEKSIVEMIHQQDMFFTTSMDMFLQDLKTIYCVGGIRYKDDLGIERMTGIFRKYDPVKSRFVAFNDNEAEYSH